MIVSYTGDTYTYLHPQVLELLHVSIKNNHMQKVMNMLPVIVVAITDILLCFAPKEYDSRLRLWLSVVNVHPLAHFNSMIAG